MNKPDDVPGCAVCEVAAKRSIQRRTLEFLWCCAPDQHRVLRALGCAPPALKGPLLERAGRVGLEITGCAPDDELPTNFANKGGPVVWLPVRAGIVRLFGTPAEHMGEASTIRLCRALLAVAGAFVDVGAHLGLFLWPLADLFGPDRPGYFFEPNPDLYRYLDANALRVTSHLHGYQVALDDHDGHSDFRLDTEDWSMSSLVENLAFKRQTVLTDVTSMRFDTFAHQVGLRDAVVKVDVGRGEAARGRR